MNIKLRYKLKAASASSSQRSCFVKYAGVFYVIIRVPDKRASPHGQLYAVYVSEHDKIC